MQKVILYIFLIAFAFSACTNNKDTVPKAALEKIDTIPMLITQVQQCSKLYTSEYHIHKIVTHDDKMKLTGSFLKQDIDINLPLGERRIAIPLDATIKVYVDMSEFSQKNIRKEGDKITIILPDPKIVLSSTKINHSEIKEYVAFMRRNFSDAELTNYEVQGRKQVLDAIPQMNIIPNAQRSTARQLVPMLTALGYKEENITITFRKPFTLHDFPHLIEKIAKG
ncbi:DUF4230 domain-containing protein [uncultured Prevotella sp.]|uniref:DUF4230 domain-containing protein n=1 Tax=uncultured Prevotella sp. TaxID=159272 RepID=UPI002582BCD6|nr:DUF4230 domain-containing protein [uncultured Prevotella sp.]